MQRLNSEKMAELSLIMMKITTIFLLCLCTGVDNEYGEPDNDVAYFRPWIRKQHLARIQGLQSDEHYIDPSSSIHPYDNHHGIIRFKRGAAVPLENGAQQLESLLILTNSLILSEAVRIKKTSIGKIVVDSLLIEQMPSDDVEWIEIVTSQQMDAGKSNGMKQKLEKTEKLKNMIDKGEAKQVNADLMSKLNVDVFQTFSNNADLLLKIEKEYGGSMYDMTTYKSAMKFMIRLPHSTKALKNLKDEKILDSLKEGYKFIKTTKQINALQLLKESQIACEKYKTEKNGLDSTQELKKCLTKLQEVAKSLTSSLLNLEEATMVFHFFLTPSHSVDLKRPQFRTTVTKFKAMMSTTKHYFEKLVKPKNGIPEPETYYRQVLEGFKALKTNKELPALKESLDLFIPLAEIADEMMILYKNQKSKTSTNNDFLNGFKSYKCLPNGAESISTLTNTAGSSASLSSEYFLSGIVKRTSVIQNWITAINPIIQHSAGLGAIKETSKGIVRIMGSSSTIPDGLEKQFVKVDSLVRKIAEDTTEIIERLDIVIKNTESLNTIPEWDKGIENLPSILTAETITPMSDLFSILPPYVDFVLTLNKTSQIQTLDIESSEQKVLESLFEKMNGIFEVLPTAVHVLKTINTIADHSTVLNGENIDDQVEKIKNEIKVAKNLNIAKLTSNVGVDMNRVADIIEKVATIDSELGNMHKDKSKFELFSKSISNVCPPSISRKKRDQNSVSNQDVDAAKQLMTGLGKIQKVDTNMDESSQIGQLMEGEPFGNDILDDMYKGMDDYRKISQQVGSVKNIKNAIADLKIEDSKLATEVETLLTGNEVLEIVPVQDKINVFEIMENIPKIDTNLEKLQKWVETRNEDDRKKIETELNGLKVSAGLMRRKQISMLHFVVSKINKPFATNIEKLRKGLKKFQEKLKSIDCRQNTAHPSCRPTESKNITVLLVVGFGGLGVIALVVILVVFIVIRKKYRRLKKEYDVNGYHMFCEDYKVQYSLLKQTPYVKGSLAFQARKEHTRAGICENFATTELDPRHIRYPDMPLKDEYRVKLPMETAGRYPIHATRINMLDDKFWIAVQAPLPTTFCNDIFYQAMIQENVTLIVQLCGDSENKIPVTYKKKGATEKYSVEVTEVEGEEQNKEAMEHTKLNVTTVATHEVTVIDHLHFKLWPDGCVPTDYDAVIELMEKVLEIEKSHKARNGKVAVHCMTGAGRTVSFMAVVYMTKLMEKKQRADFYDVVKTMRERRHMGVHSEMQYAWLFVVMAKVCSKYAKDADKPEQIDNFEKIKKLYESENSKINREYNRGLKKPWWKFW